MVQVVQIIKLIPLPLHHKVLVCFVLYSALAGCDAGRKRQVGSKAGPEAQKERGGFLSHHHLQECKPPSTALESDDAVCHLPGQASDKLYETNTKEAGTGLLTLNCLGRAWQTSFIWSIISNRPEGTA